MACSYSSTAEVACVPRYRVVGSKMFLPTNRSLTAKSPLPVLYLTTDDDLLEAWLNESLE